MKVPYFPGCTLNTTAKGFDNAVRASAAALRVELVELPEWNCCGATFPLLADNAMDLLGPADVLYKASLEGQRLATACTTCYNVMRRANYALKEDGEILEKVNYFLEHDSDYEGSVEVLDVVQILRDDVGWDRVRQAITKPLNELRVAAYYGCMVVRPPDEVAYDDPDNPTTLDDLIEALGGQPVGWPHKTECCGAYLAVKSPQATQEMSYAVLSSAARNGAELVVANCPLCQFNLDKQQRTMAQRHAGYRPIPVLYYAQLLALALGLDGSDYDLDKTYIAARPLLERVGLL
ncbi:MAG: CoB--CoM heterodisulfide reductase iron-sulfur subunit B family protein [Anaerolineae bacterium]|nr:MAG: CoB--CoM heterodisulfide reductase iron-sulfur subunit B family protein [Anaerolineae bacterium]